VAELHFLETIDATMLAGMSDVEVARTLRMNPASFEDFAQTIAQNPNSTIEPARRASSDAPGRRALEGLGEQRGQRGITSGLEIERTIGEGGMGIVRLATQRSLGRKVAVKTLRQDAKNEAATLRLLREAWVTGTLEHPNIVPVYDLGLDEDGSPIIVLKRIEGVEWGEVMQDAAIAKERYGAADLLEFNLRILVQLCNAVSLAHARGVLHRDLKPENVMIGSFGEVYLVDWGIAVSLRPDPLGRLPLASEQGEMAGTPCYMAPEMLGALGSLSERTDVYLLGAILHEILSKKPPHTGSFKQIVGSILMSTFVYDDTAPRELAEIAQRAMRREPAERFARGWWSLAWPWGDDLPGIRVVQAAKRTAASASTRRARPACHRWLRCAIASPIAKKRCCRSSVRRNSTGTSSPADNGACADFSASSSSFRRAS